MGTEIERRARKPETEMTDGEVLGNRKWPAHLTVRQCREILAHQEKIGIVEGLAR